MNPVLEAQKALISSIVSLRQSQNITQQQLSDLSGVKQPVIARLETGKTDPQLSTLLKLLTSLNVKLELKSCERTECND